MLFHILDIMNKTAMNIVYRLEGICIHFSGGLKNGIVLS